MDELRVSPRHEDAGVSLGVLNAHQVGTSRPGVVSLAGIRSASKKSFGVAEADPQLFPSKR